MNTGFQGKHVVVTGASGGIGFESTKLFLAEGARVTACYRSDPRYLSALHQSHPKQVNVVKADIREECDVENLFSSANAAFGRVDVTVTNAGIANHAGIAVHAMPLDQWQQTITVNLTGTFLCAKHFFVNLKKHPGDDAALVFVGSTSGEFGEAGFCDYSASKAALGGLLKSLKNEIVQLAVRGRVNSVNPGWTVTPMTENELSDRAAVSRILQTIPLRKVARPSDIAHAIVFLASDELSGHVSGQTITVAGGMEGRVLFSIEDVQV